MALTTHQFNDVLFKTLVSHGIDNNNYKSHLFCIKTAATFNQWGLIDKFLDVNQQRRIIIRLVRYFIKVHFIHTLFISSYNIILNLILVFMLKYLGFVRKILLKQRQVFSKFHFDLLYGHYSIEEKILGISL